MTFANILANELQNEYRWLETVSRLREAGKLNDGVPPADFKHIKAAIKDVHVSELERAKELTTQLLVRELIKRTGIVLKQPEVEYENGQLTMYLDYVQAGKGMFL